MISNAIGSVLHARAATGFGGSETPEYEVPGWTWALVLVNLAVFLPVMLWVSYHAARSSTIRTIRLFS
jgi:hypothetical protein